MLHIPVLLAVTETLCQRGIRGYLNIRDGLLLHRGRKFLNERRLIPFLRQATILINK